ncbi:MAG: hypothetical protein AABM40_03830 [Chloroflexota bacterium]
MNAKSPTLPPTPAKTGPGRKRSGPVPAWGLKLGGFLTTLGVFVGSFGYASTNLYVTNAPLQPATVAAVATVNTTTGSATAVPSTGSTTTTTLTSTVRTTTRAAVTVTKKS